MDRDAFFAQLDQLTPAEIEARLSSWNDEQLLLLAEYLKGRYPDTHSSDKPAQPTNHAPTANETRAAIAAAMASTKMATKAHMMGLLALIFAIGAMLAAMAAAYVAFIALRGSP